MHKALAVVVLAALAAGAFFWFSHGGPQAAPLPLAKVQGSSFDVPLKPVEPPPPPPSSAPSGVGATEGKPVEEKKPVEVKVEPKAAVPPPPPVEVKPVAPEPKPEPKPEVKPDPKPEPKPVVEVKPPAPVDDKPFLLTFSKLQFRYWPALKDKGARNPFPKEIRELNGKKVVMDGFMFPIDFEKGKVRSFILSNGMFGCCFGDAPSITETIKVFRADGKLMPYQSMARVTGILEVGEEFDGDGYVDSVYRIKAEDVGATQIEHK